jgi:hypothetical protein
MLDSTPLAEGLRDFFGPLFFAIVGILGVFQLFKGDITRFFQLALLGIGVSILLYRPDVLRAIGEIIATLLPGAGGTGAP